MDVIARDECPEHGADTGLTFTERDSRRRCGHGNRRDCGKVLVRVEYVPRSHLEGAVEALDEAIKAARLFNRNGMTWLEYDRKLVELEQIVNRARGQ